MKETKNGVNIGSDFPLNRIDENLSWKIRSFEDQGKRFYVIVRYFCVPKIFALYVTLADVPKIAEKYLAYMSINDDVDPERRMTMTTNVISIEKLPNIEKTILDNADCWRISMFVLKSFLKTETKEDLGETITVGASVKIMNKP